MKNWTLEVGDLFSVVGMKTRGLVEMNENTYDFDPKNPKDSWLYPVLLGFQELKRQGFAPKSFATIGTGSGIDSIGVYEILGPTKIYQVDVHPNVLELAHKNAAGIIGRGADIETVQGDLCEPLIKRDVKVDLVYANLPNIPDENLVFERKVTASRYVVRDPEDCPEVLQKWLLELQYLFVKQAKQILNPGGVIVDAIGARVPFEALEQVFTANRCRASELVSLYKVQSEMEDTLSYYAKNEGNGVEFDYYDHEKAWLFWQKELEHKRWATPELKEALKPFRVSAKQASEAFEKEGRQFGHVCSIFKAIL